MVTFNDDMTCISLAVKNPSFNKFGVGKGYPSYLKIFTFSGFSRVIIDAPLFKGVTTLFTTWASKKGTTFEIGRLDWR